MLRGTRLKRQLYACVCVFRHNSLTLLGASKQDKLPQSSEGQRGKAKHIIKTQSFHFKGWHKALICRLSCKVTTINDIQKGLSIETHVNTD